MLPVLTTDLWTILDRILRWLAFARTEPQINIVPFHLPEMLCRLDESRDQHRRLNRPFNARAFVTLRGTIIWAIRLCEQLQIAIDAGDGMVANAIHVKILECCRLMEQEAVRWFWRELVV